MSQLHKYSPSFDLYPGKEEFRQIWDILQLYRRAFSSFMRMVELINGGVRIDPDQGTPEQKEQLRGLQRELAHSIEKLKNIKLRPIEIPVILEGGRGSNKQSKVRTTILKEPQWHRVKAFETPKKNSASNDDTHQNYFPGAYNDEHFDF